MQRTTTNKKSRILFLALIMVSLHLPAHAEIVDYHLDFSVKPSNNGFEVRRSTDMQRRQTDEIIRGNDLARSVSALIQKTKDYFSILKGRQTDQLRGVELNRITNSNTKDIIRRNKINQQMQKRLIKDQMQSVKAKNRALKQRIRDMSRR